MSKRVVIATLAGVSIVLVFLLLVSMTRTRQPLQAEWGQGYESRTGDGRYYEPDHGYFYYWMTYHLLFGNPQPTYHVYLPPAGYAPTYRPWQPQAVTVRPTTAVPQRPAETNSRTTGGFSSQPSPQPSSRTSGGFSQSSPTQSSSPSRSPSSSPRTGGGFSSSSSSSSRPAQSSPSSRPSSRTSGGFGGKR